MRRRTSQQSVVEVVIEMVLRMPQCRLLKQRIGCTPSGRRSARRSKDTWWRTMACEMRENDLDHDNVVAISEERSAWRNFVADLWNTWGPDKINPFKPMFWKFEFEHEILCSALSSYLEVLSQKWWISFFRFLIILTFLLIRTLTWISQVMQSFLTFLHRNLWDS